MPHLKKANKNYDKRRLTFTIEQRVKWQREWLWALFCVRVSASSRTTQHHIRCQTTGYALGFRYDLNSPTLTYAYIRRIFVFFYSKPNFFYATTHYRHITRHNVNRRKHSDRFKDTLNERKRKQISICFSTAIDESIYKITPSSFTLILIKLLMSFIVILFYPNISKAKILTENSDLCRLELLIATILFIWNSYNWKITKMTKHSFASTCFFELCLNLHYVYNSQCRFCSDSSRHY